MNLAADGEVAALDGLLTGRFISLHTASPGTTGANEITTPGTGYARQAFPYTKVGSNPTIGTNSTTIDFPSALSAWGDITHYGIWSAASGGVFIGGDPLSATRTIGIGDIARFSPSSLVISCD